jgi:hypothetical protein
MSQPEFIFVGPVTQESAAWADETVKLYEKKLFVPSEPFPPRMEGDLLMQIPVDGEHALHQAGYWLNPNCVYVSPAPHVALGICKIVKF